VNTCLSRYLTWIRRSGNHIAALGNELNELETNMRRHPDFAETPKDLLDKIVVFRQAAGLEAYAEHQNDEMSFVSRDQSSVGRSQRRRRGSYAPSVSTMRSKTSTVVGTLTPLPENSVAGSEDESDNEYTLSPASRTPSARVRSRLGMSHSLSTIEATRKGEEDEVSLDSTSTT
jgi:hypothetical protein